MSPNSKKLLSFVTCFLLLIGFLGQQAMAGAKMPAFSLKSAANGETIASSSFDGKAKLVVFFATWCMPCMQEVPTLISLQDEYGPQGFSVIAISVDRRAMDMQRFINRTNVNYPILMADKKIINSFGGIPGLPTTFLISPSGTVLKKYPGLVPHALLEREVKKILP